MPAASWKHATQRFLISQGLGLDPGKFSSTRIFHHDSGCQQRPLHGRNSVSETVGYYFSDAHLLRAGVLSKHTGELEKEASWASLGGLDFDSCLLLEIFSRETLKQCEEQNNLIPEEQHLAKEVSQCPQTPSMRPAPGFCSTLCIFLSRFPSLLLLCFP